MRIARCAAIVALSPLALSAQVVRGVVTERVSGQPVAGVLISVARTPDSLSNGGIRHALTNVRGEYAVKLPDGGSFQVSAKRIGVVRFTAPVFAIAAGETKRIDMALAPFESRLPQVVVSATNLCLPKPDQLRTIVALWDEARTALIASEVSAKDQQLNGWLSQYQRSLEPRSLRILQDQRSVAEGLYDRPMRSISGDSLAKVGFWRTLHADMMEFHGPDAEALLSNAFQSEHCFELVQGSGPQRGLLGLTFRPRRIRNMGQINGTIWLDGANFELRFVVFRYTNLITIPATPHLGGEVHFFRHETGAWVVRRWFIRMPQFATIQPAIPRGNVAPPTPRPYVYRIIEQGGGLFMPRLRTWEKPGSIEGTIVDSTGQRPLRDAMISLSGTPYSTEVDSAGRFRFDSIPPGAYTLLASTRDYAGLGQLAGDEPLNVVAGETYRSRMKAIATSELLAVLCDGKPIKPGQATVRITFTDIDSGHVVPRLPVWLRRPDSKQRESIDPNARGPIIVTDSGPAGEPLLGVHRTDIGGAATFCGVPADTWLELVMLRPDDDPEYAQGARYVRVTSFMLRAGEVVSRTVAVKPPK